MLGDIVLAAETVAREAELEDKPLEHHITHLVIHGLLHLLGHDHEDRRRGRGDGGARAAQRLRGLPFPIPTRNRQGPIDRTTMNDTPETAAQPRSRQATRPHPKQPEDGPSPSTRRVAPAQPIDRPSFLRTRCAACFRQRNGTSLREEIADALAETATDAESFSPGERAMLNNILRLREVRVEDVMVPRADIEAVEIIDDARRP